MRSAWGVGRKTLHKTRLPVVKQLQHRNPLRSLRWHNRHLPTPRLSLRRTLPLAVVDWPPHRPQRLHPLPRQSLLRLTRSVARTRRPPIRHQKSLKGPGIMAKIKPDIFILKARPSLLLTS
jgi:hypothetical protein